MEHRTTGKDENLFRYWNHIGGRAYFCVKGQSNRCFRSLSAALGARPDVERRLDPAAVLGVLMKSYPIADRTMIAAVKRTPWMARPGQDDGWEYAPVPGHGMESVPAVSRVAERLLELLYAEALEFISGKSTIGVLLSGGMDSRIVAGVVRLAQLRGDFDGDVVALSWGIGESRDVRYARTIAARLKWDFVHFPVNAETLARNIYMAGKLGAEFSPIHLHAIPDIASLEGISGVLAGSYGDSIGRGEYSGAPVSRQRRLLSTHHNHFSFLLRDVQREAHRCIRADLLKARRLYPRSTEMAYREQELQMHYMRRQLNACFDMLDDEIPVYQMFTAYPVVREMWRLAPAGRTDEIYGAVLQSLPGDLLTVPWARTGRPFNTANVSPEDSYPSLNHQYGRWLRQDCRSIIIELIDSGSLHEMAVFNDRALDMWKRWWSRSSLERATRIDEKIAWLASLSHCIDIHRIAAAEPAGKRSWMDTVAEYGAWVHGMAYQRWSERGA